MTVTQQQCLLTYLGYAPGSVDGIAGAKTKAAIAAYQADAGLKADGIGGHDTEGELIKWVAAGKQRPQQQAGDFWADIRYFSRQEFRCPCSRCGGFPAEPRETLVRAADRIRSQAGNIADVSSGVRCDAHNAELPGSAANSRHLSGGAMDFRIRGMSSARLLTLAQSQPEIRFAYAIDDSFVHMEIGE